APAASDGRLCAVGGATTGGSLVATVEEDDPATNVWTTKTNMPTARNALGLAAAPNGKLYAVGGLNGSARAATVEEYDPTTNTWTNYGTPPPGNACRPMPAARKPRAHAP